MRVSLLIICVLFAFSSCRKSLCYETNHPHDGAIEVVLDRGLMDDNTEQVRLHFYPMSQGVPRAQTGQPYVRFISRQHSMIDLPEGVYSVIAINDNTDYVRFRGMDSYLIHEVYMDRITRGEYNSTGMRRANVAGTKMTIGQPDMLYVTNVDEFMVVKDKSLQQPLSLRPRCVVITLRMSIAIEGMKNVALARGEMEGVSSSLFLHSGQANVQSVASMFFNCDVTASGIVFSLTAFSIIAPDKTLPVEEQIRQNLSLDFMLKDGKVKKYEFDITDLIEDAHREEGGSLEIPDLDIDIPEVDPGDGGFNPDIEDWGDEEDVEIPI